MSVCIVRPPLAVSKWNQVTVVNPPIGPAYVAGTLREGGHKVSLIDGIGLGLDERHPADGDILIYGLALSDIVNRVPDDAKIIGVSCLFSVEWPMCNELIELLRRRHPKALLVGGGEHLTALPEYSLKTSPLDVIVNGEGEETMLAVADSYLGRAFDPATISGISYKDNDGNIYTNKPRGRIRDLDTIPWPAWDLVPVDDYMDRNLSFGVNRGRSMPLLASRGCPYQCTFCSNPAMWTTRWNVRSIDPLLEEISYYQKRYRATNFDFYDLTAIVKKQWIVEFCRKLIDNKMDFTWQLPSGTRSEVIDEEVSKLLYEANCKNLSYAPESGAPRVLERIKKRIKPERMVESIRSSVRLGINVKTNMMIGFPGETYSDIWSSFRFITKVALAGSHDLSYFAFAPYPGSALFTELQKQGKITLNTDFFDALRSYSDPSKSVSYSEHISDRSLKYLRVLGLLLFYFVSWLRWPLRPFQTVIHLARGQHESRMEMMLAGIIDRVFKHNRRPHAS